MYFMYNKHIIILDRLITVAFAIMITLFTFLFCSCLVHVYILTTSPCFVAFLMDIHRANIYTVYMYIYDPGKNCHWCILFSYHWEMNELFLSLCVAAVDYLAKNVSLSTQRRMKLGEHSAVLGLLQVETGQAYWWISNWTSTHQFHQHLFMLSAAPTHGPSD